MPAEGDQDFLDLYARELAYLRERGAEFSASYPKVAARLGISGHHGSDPHVERLLESFAFLTARIQRNVEADFPELTNALLGVLYPQYGSPVPAMAIASFAADMKITSGHTIAKHTPLFAEASGGVACWFRTCAPVTLWPIQISAAAFVAPELLDIPTSMSGVAAALRMDGRALATSGDYERYLVVDGRRYCHLLDPRTGWPVTHWRSISVLAPLAVVAGNCATIGMLLQERALDFLDASGTQYLAIDQQGRVHQRAAEPATVP